MCWLFEKNSHSSQLIYKNVSFELWVFFMVKAKCNTSPAKREQKFWKNGHFSQIVIFLRFKHIFINQRPLKKFVNFVKFRKFCRNTVEILKTLLNLLLHKVSRYFFHQIIIVKKKITVKHRQICQTWIISIECGYLVKLHENLVKMEIYLILNSCKS